MAIRHWNWDPWLSAGRCAVLGVLMLSFLPACKDDGLSEYERMKKREEGAVQSLTEKGIKANRVRYPQGEAWALDFTGLEIKDDILKKLKGIGYISEINLSRSTITDDQLAIINDPEIGALLVKLNLSHTAITDAGLDKLTSQLVLTELNLAGTKVTAAGVDRLKKRRQQDRNIRIKNTNIILK